MITYLTDIQQYAREAAASGETLGYWLGQEVPPPFGEWAMSHVFIWNFRWLFERYQAEAGGGQ
ncbi:hypothetical protein D3C75_1312930 [compost metagenome]